MKNKENKTKLILIICNIMLILLTVTAAGIYSRHIYQTQQETKEAGFTRMVESMKQVSRNYLDSERGYAKELAQYMYSQNMTLEEALDFLRSINTSKDRLIHIVDMDTYEAYSSYYPKGEEKIDTYKEYKNEGSEADVPFGTIMQRMFTGSDEEFNVLGKYRLPETQAMGVGIGTRVTLETDEGKKGYLLLRIVPIDILRKSWIFPVEYSSAEVGIITNTGDYVIQSPSMKSQNFLEYIRGYNFQDDYNKKTELRTQLEHTESGTLLYKNFRGTECLWYYSSFGTNSSLDMIGMLSSEELKPSAEVWSLVVFVGGMLAVLALVDGLYLIRINRKLHETVRMAEQANKAKTQFLSAMSHDIRTPLNAVLGMMEIAEKKASDPAAVVDCMDKGIHSGKQLLTLINDVLDISKIESGKVTLNQERVSLEKIAHNLLEIMTVNVAKKKLQLKYDFDSLPYKYVYADGMRLSQIYVNLLTNAVKYTNAGGMIQLRLYEEEIPDQPSHVKLLFYVEDTGIGMTKEFQKNMYNAFTREVSTQVNRTQGTGLGLSIVKQMVDLMEGVIICKSAPGVGTSFLVSVDLPIAESGEETEVNEINTKNIENMHLLMAEDNELNWEVFHELISEKGIVCDRAENGQECIDMLLAAEDGTYDVILMDVNMPVMNGYEATKKIRSMPDEKRKNIPILAITADAFAEDVKACLDCGMNGHIAKPIDMNRLIEYLIRIRNGQL